ncbi:arogenate dehydratase/prephenate dehydratase 2, chloroplastic-like [Macadamia integrifolia]|uniref:arogenate dehydratase/prephenate dehydratase 2, chloroplastic-like n=1 Tax=Macadamia integrifolia TaxID=60698 RepID=UPI001C4F5E94|nr:arogenate dehydratase/prephenate dehydratase 2, chloroplastic-like [Macadamia integrifolia]
MALRIPLPIGPRSGYEFVRSDNSSCSSFGLSLGGSGSGSGSGSRGVAVIKSSLNQQRRDTKDTSPKSSSVLQTPEKIASAFGHETLIADLERLFKQAADPFRPQLSGPFSPSTGVGFSGRPVRVAYQGVRGSYCQEAAIKAFSQVCDAFPCDHMEDAFEALEHKAADRAIIPVENSIDGTIDRNFDLLIRHGDVNIVGELVLPVNHCLLAFPGTSRSDLKRIVSHPQALNHCKTRLESLDLEVEEVSNAADAARFVSENRISDTAVIGSRIAAKEFGLKVMDQNLQDGNCNFNRFLQLGLGSGLEPLSLAGKTRTTVAFSLQNGVSDLFRALWIFESRNVSVTRVEHRPNRSAPIRVVEKGTEEFRYFDYVFILDLEGSVSEAGIRGALKGLEEISGFLRVLGCYTCGH